MCEGKEGLWSFLSSFLWCMAVRVFGPYQALASGMAAGIVLRTVSRVTVIKGLYSLAHKQTSALHEFTSCIVTYHHALASRQHTWY